VRFNFGPAVTFNKNFDIVLFKCVCVALMFCLSETSANDVSQEPETIISKISSEIIQKIRENPKLSSGNWELINELVDATVMPIVDFQKMTALAVGKSWRLASDKQKEKLMVVFRELLLLSYAGAIKFAEKASVTILPSRRSASDNNAIVRTKVAVPGRQAISIDYRLKKTSTGWKIYDLNVLGLWLVENYRSQFSQIVSTNGVDGLIYAISEKNKLIRNKKNKK